MKRSSMAYAFFATLISVLVASQGALAASSLQSQDPKLKPRTKNESCADRDKSPRDSVAQIVPPSSGQDTHVSRLKDEKIIQ